MRTEASFERPTKGVLQIKLSNGEVLSDPSYSDLKKFGLVDRLSVYKRLDEFLQKVANTVNGTGSEVTDLKLNPLRYAFELACYDDDELDPNTVNIELLAQVIALERTLALNTPAEAGV